MGQDAIHGVINIHKQKGMTSFDVIARLRKILKTKKIGHTGTLDPDATGVLPVCVGKATRISELIMGQDKVYKAQITFGVETDTQDAAGKVLNAADTSHLTEKGIYDAIQCFIGTYHQVPPMYSAIKIGGRKLYELAREGKEIERNPRAVQIESIIIDKVDLMSSPPTAVIEVMCSKGTYIRTLCHDIGIKLGCGAHMSELVRTATGSFKLSDAYTLDAVREMEENQMAQNQREENKLDRSYLIPLEDVLSSYPKIYLNERESRLFTNGVKIAISQERLLHEGVYRIFNSDHLFIALGSVQSDGQQFILKTYKSFF